MCGDLVRTNHRWLLSEVRPSLTQQHRVLSNSHYKMAVAVQLDMLKPHQLSPTSHVCLEPYVISLLAAWNGETILRTPCSRLSVDYETSCSLVELPPHHRRHHTLDFCLTIPVPSNPQSSH